MWVGDIVEYACGDELKLEVGIIMGGDGEKSGGRLNFCFFFFCLFLFLTTSNPHPAARDVINLNLEYWQSHVGIRRRDGTWIRGESTTWSTTH